MRENKVAEMLKFLNESHGKAVEIKDIVNTTLANMFCNLCFSVDIKDFGTDVADEFKEIVTAMEELVTTPNVADLYPSLLGKLDPQGLRRKASEYQNKLKTIWGRIIDNRRAENGLDEIEPKDFLDALIANGFSDEQITFLISELFGAGTETASITIEWAMTELLRNEEAMKYLSEELSREIKSGPIKESDLSRLPYLHACVKENFRLHAPTPFLIPHRAIHACEVMNYTIPKDSQILVNVWAIGRDPDVWDNPLSFKPERFLGSNIDFKGHNFELLPFGSGRRICPGLPLASKQVLLILSSLVHNFRWSLMNGEDPLKIDMNETLGITLEKEKPLLVMPIKK